MNSAFEKLSKNSKLTSFLTQKTPILQSILAGKSAEIAAKSQVDALNAQDLETYFASTEAHKVRLSMHILSFKLFANIILFLP